MTQTDAITVAEVYSHLVHEARSEGNVSYAELANRITTIPLDTSIPQYGRQMSELLNAVAERSLAEHGVILPVLVVKKGTRRPGDGFFDFAEAHRDTTDRDTLVLDETARVYKAYAQ